jgi:hypothetical protein
MKKKMNDFEKLVKKYYDNNSDEQISNGSMKHAKILVKYLFLYAKKTGKDVKIITGTLEKDFYNLFTESIKDILNNNKVSIISENACEDSVFKQTVLNSSNGSIAENNTNSLPHFILVGNATYRLETDDNLKLATASFNRPNIGKFLLDIFNTA